jgi:thiamine biosynthesis lipoprotein ApbE
MAYHACRLPCCHDWFVVRPGCACHSSLAGVSDRPTPLGKQSATKTTVSRWRVPIKVVAYGDDSQLLRKAVDSAFDEVDRIDRLMSHYKPESTLSRLNREAYARSGDSRSGVV